MSQNPRGRTGWVAGCLFFFVVFIAGLIAGGLLSFFGEEDTETLTGGQNGDKVALVRLDGPIVDARKIIRQIDDWADTDDIRAIILRVTSPGGVVGPTQEIHDAIIRARKRKPVVASLGSVAASGGLYAAVACDKIVANPGTLTGSVGVVMLFSTTYELFQKIGLGSMVIKSGKYKDIGSPHRDMTPEEQKLLQGMVDDIHHQFTTAVADGRGLPMEKVATFADGRLLTGRIALELGLVDELGGQRQAVLLAAKLAGIEGEPAVVEKKDKTPFMEALMGEDFDVSLSPLTARPAGAWFIWPAAL